ncbi:MAG: glycosyltransferase family 4 protein [Thermoplasmata archaeon]|nr:glycosyltransferase family 4 protein [Thermoplasmata archaeon]
MEIAQLSTRFPPGPGGVERHVYEVAKRLAKRGHKVTVYTSDLYREIPWQKLDPSIPRTLGVEGFTVKRLPVWTLPGELHYPFFRGLDKVLKEDAPELLHAHTYGTNHASVAARHARSSRVPLVLSAHYHPIWSIYGGWVRHRLRGFYDRALAGRVVRSAARVIVQSQEEERLMRVNHFQIPKVERIPPGYSALPDPPPGEHPFATRLGISGPFALFVGRLASNKGLLPLIDAFENVARHDPTAELVLVGEDGGMRAAVYARLKERGLENRVRLTGYLEDEALLASAFREARLFVLPSEYEAFGLVLLEALAQGTPVIASRVGGIPEFVPDKEAGLLVPPLDAVALSRAMLELWDDPARRTALGRYGREHVVPMYTWERLVDRLEALYEEVARR